MRPNRRQAGSHRITTGTDNCAVPVGVGLPANGLQSGPPQSQMLNRPTIPRNCCPSCSSSPLEAAVCSLAALV
ncbi:hypothetical protein D0O09_20980 [Pseudomonas putida]|nr:hypothetical protein D0O09_20980 [Pseudomonas putida]